MSGLGRELGEYGLQAYTEVKTVRYAKTVETMYGARTRLIGFNVNTSNSIQPHCIIYKNYQNHHLYIDISN